MMNKLIKFLKRYSSRISTMFAAASFFLYVQVTHASVVGALFNFTQLGTELRKFLLTGLVDVCRFMGIVLLWAASLFVYIAGQGLDYIVFFTVVKMGQIVNALPGIETGWLMFRDATNLVFIFALIYTGILLIVDSKLLAQKGMLDYRKMLVMLVVAALLVNFSLFFTKGLVDVSNVIATKLYSLTNQQSLSVSLMNSMSAVEIATNNSLPTYDTVSNAIGSDAAASAATSDLKIGLGMLMRGIFGGAVLIVAGLSFIAISFFLILRFILVIYLLVTSPFYFAGLVLPAIRSIFGDWLKTLISQCLFPIVYFLFLLVLLFFTVGGTNPNTNVTFTPANITSILAPSNSQTDQNLQEAIGISFSKLLQFVLIIAGLIGSLKLAVSISNKGASGIDAKIRQYAGKGSNYLTRRAFNVAGGVAGTVAAPINRIPLVGKPFVGMAGGIGKAAAYGVNRFGQATGTGDMTGAMVAGTAAGFGTMRDIKPGEVLKKLNNFTAVDPKKVDERLTQKKKEISDRVDKESRKNLAIQQANVERTGVELAAAQENFDHVMANVASTPDQKRAASDRLTDALASHKEEKKAESKIKKAIAKDKRREMNKWISGNRSVTVLGAKVSIRRPFRSRLDRATARKASQDVPSDPKEKEEAEVQSMNDLLDSFAQVGDTAAIIKKVDTEISDKMFAKIKPSVLLRKQDGADDADIPPMVSMLTPNMLRLLAKNQSEWTRKDRNDLLEKLEARIAGAPTAADDAIDTYLRDTKNSAWLRK